MKFGKLLKETTEGMGPEMHDLFVRYKELKKYLKAMKKQKQTEAGAAAHVPKVVEEYQEASTSGNQEQALDNVLSAEEKAFVDMLNEDLLRFNRFFIDKEEDSVIKLQALSDRMKAATGSEELQALKAELVDFHGEMVLLLHWSLLNYAAVVKILKKHDKCSGLLLRAPYLANVLQQPFYSTSVMSRLVKMAEEHINALVAKQQSQEDTPDPAAGLSTTATSAPPGSEAAGEHAAELEGTAQAAAAAGAVEGAGAADHDDSSSLDEDNNLPVDTAVFARTRMALQTWDQLCTTASTPSTVLPAGSTELVRQLRVRERWAKLVGVPPGGQQLQQPEQPQPEQTSTQPVVQRDSQQQQQQQQAEAGAAAAALSPAGDAAAHERRGKHDATEVEGETVAKRQRC